METSKTIREATRGITDEYRDMNVGDVVYFPIPKYNYNSIRATPTSTLVRARLEGCKWKSKLDLANRRVVVTRIA